MQPEIDLRTKYWKWRPTFWKRPCCQYSRHEMWVTTSLSTCYLVDLLAYWPTTTILIPRNWTQIILNIEHFGNHIIKFKRINLFYFHCKTWYYFLCFIKFEMFYHLIKKQTRKYQWNAERWLTAENLNWLPAASWW